MTLLKRLVLPLLAILVIFEEWLWDILTIAGQGLSLVLHLQRFDLRLSKASPNEALVALAIPVLIVTPINLFALYLLANGSILPGLGLEIVAKLVGTLLVARVFRLVRPALLSFPWFAWIYNRIIGLLRWAHTLIQTTALYRMSIVLKREIKIRVGTLLRAYGHR